MNEKWTKEQIETAKRLFITGCDGVDCSSCLLLDKDDGCLIIKDIGSCPLIRYINYKEKFENLIHQHEYDDADDETDTYKQTIPPHTGTTRVLDYVLADLNSRAKMGKQKYGHYLETDNGRNALQDAYEECLDLCMYLKQKLLEDQGK